MVVFFTSFAEGHETRFISALTSRQNCASRPKAFVLGPLKPRSRRVPRPSWPSPKRAVRGAGGAWGFSISAMMSPTFFDTQHSLSHYLAGVPGFEPGLSVLETDVLTVDTIPLREEVSGTG